MSESDRMEKAVKDSIAVSQELYDLCCDYRKDIAAAQYQTDRAIEMCKRYRDQFDRMKSKATAASDQLKSFLEAWRRCPGRSCSESEWNEWLATMPAKE